MLIFKAYCKSQEQYKKNFKKMLSLVRYEYRFFIWQILRVFRKSTTIQIKQGIYTLPLEISDPISEILFTTREFELNLMVKAMNLIREQHGGAIKGQGTILDIGANNGVTSIGMLVTGELGQAIAIEPEPGNFSRLKNNSSQNHLENKIHCINMGVSDSNAGLEFELSKRNYGDHRIRSQVEHVQNKELLEESKREVIKIQVDTLDNILSTLNQSLVESLSVIWIDIQGYEGYAFAGAKKILATGIPVVAEFWPYVMFRAGMSKIQYCELVGTIWSSYWVKRNEIFVQYPIEIIYTLFDEIGNGHNSTNIIFNK